MKPHKIPKSPNYYLFLLFFLITTLSFSQVGINTTSPDGALDVNSTTQGIVLPRVALTATNASGPVVNPAGGALAVGTVVFNTATTSNGTYDVVPGIYVWNGTEWFAKFTKKQAELYTQSSYTRPSSSAGFEDITGLVSQTFTANYTGTYKIEVSVNYGTGYAADNDSETDAVAIDATFRFTFDGTDYDIPISSWAVQGSTTYYLIWEQASYVLYVDLVAGNNYNFGLQVDQGDGTGLENSGDSGNGLGYTGYDVPCSVEFIFIAE